MCLFCRSFYLFHLYLLLYFFCFSNYRWTRQVPDVDSIMIFFMLITLLKVFTGFLLCILCYFLIVLETIKLFLFFFYFSISVKNYGSRFSCFAHLKHFFLNLFQLFSSQKKKFTLTNKSYFSVTLNNRKR